MQRGRFSALMMGFMSVTMAITAHAANFDCQQAATAIEQAICENPAANALDEQVGDLYAQLLKALPQAKAAELKAEQDEWLTQRNQACAQPDENLSACLLSQMKARSAALASQLFYPDGSRQLSFYAALPGEQGRIEVFGWQEEESSDEPYIEKYVIAMPSASGSAQTMEGETNDPVVDAQLTDLNHDGQREVLLITEALGSGSYGNILLLTGQAPPLTIYTLPALTDEQGQGYRGADHFFVNEANALIREYPLYNEKDANVNPTGGMMRVIYRFDPAQGGFAVEQATKLPE